MPTPQSFIRRITFAFAAVAVMFLSGCATSQQAYLANSAPAQRIECSGVFGSWDSCRSEALVACGDQGYQVLSRNREEGISEAEADQREADKSFHERNMLVQCGTGGNRLALLGNNPDAAAQL